MVLSHWKVGQFEEHGNSAKDIDDMVFELRAHPQGEDRTVLKQEDNEDIEGFNMPTS